MIVKVVFSVVRNEKLSDGNPVACKKKVMISGTREWWMPESTEGRDLLSLMLQNDRPIFIPASPRSR